MEPVEKNRAKKEGQHRTENKNQTQIREHLHLMESENEPSKKNLPKPDSIKNFTAQE